MLRPAACSPQCDAELTRQKWPAHHRRRAVFAFDEVALRVQLNVEFVAQPEAVNLCNDDYRISAIQNITVISSY